MSTHFPQVHLEELWNRPRRWTSSCVPGKLIQNSELLSALVLTESQKLVSIPFVGLCIELVNIGAGRSGLFLGYILDLSGKTRLQIIDSVAHLIYSTALVLCRISGLAFYYRICSLHKEFLIAIKVIFATLILAYVAQMCLIIFHCQPVTLLWASRDYYDDEFESRVCLWWFEIYSIISSISLVCDFLLFGIPAAMLKVLELSGKQKLQLACTLLPGVL